ncbi:putative Ig domain-containing protein [Terriglobus roseus]|uniref:Putative Ig domain-containing protein n=1 Tax=Terriglobus roseus TaxID=392734 RepID=A0A1G7FDK5_9BACT|nr:putative Ig domain-containing protein [Terriglobus roseus]SDE73625.1 Putative Ig domain-containing protein [Terriglobus roseus]
MMQTRTIPRLFLCCLLLLSGCGQQETKTPDSPQQITAPELLPLTLPLAIVGTTYSTSLLARYGTSPYTYAVTSGAPPTGLTLSSGGALTGNPTGTGTYAFQITLTDSETPAKTATQSFSLNSSTRLQVASTVSVQIARGASFTSRLLSGGTAPYSFSIASGTLPDSVALNADGSVSGTASVAAPFTATIRWTDFVGQTGTGTVDILVTSPPLVATTVAPLIVPINQNILQPLTVQGGTSPYTFAITSGTLPTGVTLTSTGTLQGQVTQPGTYNVVVSVTDSTIPSKTITIPVSFLVSTTSVHVNSDIPLRTISAEAYGIHTSVYDHSIGDITGTAPLLVTAGAKVLRFPGGSYSDRYHWAQHTLTPNFSPNDTGACANIWNGYLAANSDFGNFAKLLQASGATGIVTVNYGTSVADASGTISTSWSGDNDCSAPNTGGQPQEAAAWVAYANGAPGNTQTIGTDATGYDWKTVGYWASLRASQPLAQDDGFNFLRLGMTTPIGVRYWEIGNEIYYNGYNSILTETDLHAPFIYSNGYSNDPDSRQGISTLSPTAYGTGAAAYANAMRAVDPTIQVGIVVGSDIDPIPSTWTSDVLTAACSQATFDFTILHYYPGTYNAVTTDELLSNPQKDFPGIVQGIQSQTNSLCTTSRTPMPIFMTETNPNGTLATTTPDVATALFAAHDLLTSFESGIDNAEWLELHGGAGTFLSEAEAPGPAFYGFQLATILASAGDQLVMTTSASSNLLVHAAKQKSGKLSVMLINRGTTDTAYVNVQGKGALTNITRYEYGSLTTPTNAKLVGKSLDNNAASAISVAPLTAVVIVADESSSAN